MNTNLDFSHSFSEGHDKSEPSSGKSLRGRKVKGSASSGSSTVSAMDNFIELRRKMGDRADDDSSQFPKSKKLGKTGKTGKSQSVSKSVSEYDQRPDTDAIAGRLAAKHSQYINRLKKSVQEISDTRDSSLYRLPSQAASLLEGEANLDQVRRLYSECLVAVINFDSSSLLKAVDSLSKEVFLDQAFSSLMSYIARVAIMLNSEECAGVLLSPSKSGLEISSSGDFSVIDGIPAVSYAANCGSYETFLLLADGEEGVSSCRDLNTGNNVLHNAVASKNVRIAGYILERFPNLSTVKNFNGHTPVVSAAIYGFNELIRTAGSLNSRSLCDENLLPYVLISTSRARQCGIPMANAVDSCKSIMEFVIQTRGFGLTEQEITSTIVYFLSGSIEATEISSVAEFMGTSVNISEAGSHVMDYIVGVGETSDVLGKKISMLLRLGLLKGSRFPEAGVPIPLNSESGELIQELEKIGASIDYSRSLSRTLGAASNLSDIRSVPDALFKAIGLDGFFALCKSESVHPIELLAACDFKITKDFVISISRGDLKRLPLVITDPLDGFDSSFLEESIIAPVVSGSSAQQEWFLDNIQSILKLSSVCPRERLISMFQKFMKSFAGGEFSNLAFKEVILKLLLIGAIPVDTTIDSADNGTVMHVLGHDQDLANLLLECGPDLEIRNDYGRNVIEHMIFHSRVPSASLISYRNIQLDQSPDEGSGVDGLGEVGEEIARTGLRRVEIEEGVDSLLHEDFPSEIDEPGIVSEQQSGADRLAAELGLTSRDGVASLRDIADMNDDEGVGLTLGSGIIESLKQLLPGSGDRSNSENRSPASAIEELASSIVQSAYT